MNNKILMLILMSCMSYVEAKRLYVNEYLAVKSNLQDTQNKVKQWFFDELKPGKFSGSSRMTELHNVITHHEVTMIINALKDRSFDDVQQFYNELKDRVNKQAKQLAENRLRTELSLSLNNNCFDTLSFNERSGVIQAVGSEINNQKTSASCAYDLLYNNSITKLEDRLTETAWQKYGKQCSTHLVMPSAPSYTYKKQQEKQQGKQLVEDIKHCKQSPHCWASISAYLHKNN